MSGKIDRGRVATDETYKNLMRLECQTDVLFLGRVLGYDRIVDRVHRPVAELCVQKNPALPIEQQAEKKQSLNLDPRGTFKSTFSIIDSVQWIICFPNIRICKLTATKPLAAAIAEEIRDHFVKAADAEPTDFQLLFPEFCISPKEKRAGEYTAPNRTRNWRERTVMSFSIETSISGWHFDVFDPDDVVDTQNSSTPAGIAKVKKNYRINKKTAMPWAYINFKGTRYNPFDLWGDIIEKANPKKIKVLVRSALQLKNGERLQPGDFPPESEMDLLFPELLSYEFLKGEFEEDYESFMTQYMNDAHGGKEVTFPREKLLQATLQADQMPVAGETFVAWRFPYNGKPAMKEASGAAAVLENGRMYVVDVINGTFAPSALAHRVVQQAKRFGAHKVMIEESPGARYFEPAIQNYALALGWTLSITWLEFQEDDGARDLRLKGLEPMITAMRVVFSESMKKLAEVVKQFANYGMIDDNGIVDVIARVAEGLPKSIAAADSNPEQDMAWEMAKQRDLYDRTHGLGNYAPAQPEQQEAPYKPQSAPFGLHDELGCGLIG